MSTRRRRMLARASFVLLLTFTLLLAGVALRERTQEVRDGAGYVTTSINVAWSIAAVLVFLIVMRFLPLPAKLRGSIQWFALCAIALHSVGLLFGLYRVFWWYDDALHVVLPAGSSVLLVRVAQALDLFPPQLSTRLRVALLTILIGLASAAVWEIFEFVMGTLQGTRLQADLVDTMRDMIDGGVGGLLAAWWAARHPRPAEIPPSGVDPSH